MPRDFIDEDLMMDGRKPRLPIGANRESALEGDIPSSKEVPRRPIDDLDLTGGLGGRLSPAAERAANQAGAKQEEILALQEKQKELEEERQLLEELYRKQKAYEEARAGLETYFANARETVRAEREALAARATACEEALSAIDGLEAKAGEVKDEDWEGSKILEELDKATALFAALRAEGEKAVGAAVRGGKGKGFGAFLPPMGDGPKANLVRGTMFFLPLMVFLVLFAAIGIAFFLRYA
jgi:hypothetical protein